MGPNPFEKSTSIAALVVKWFRAKLGQIEDRHIPQDAVSEGLKYSILWPQAAYWYARRGSNLYLCPVIH